MEEEEGEGGGLVGEEEGEEEEEERKKKKKMMMMMMDGSASLCDNVLQRKLSLAGQILMRKGLLPPVYKSGTSSF